MGFPPLPATFSPDNERWTVQHGKAGPDFKTLSVSAPTDISPASRYRRAHTNATVHHGHRELAAFCNEHNIPLEVANAVDYGRVSSVLAQVNAICHDGDYDDYEDAPDGYTTKTSEAVDLNPGERLPEDALHFYENMDDIVSSFSTITRAVVGGHYRDTRKLYNYLNATPYAEDPAELSRKALYRKALKRAIETTTGALCTDEPNRDRLEDYEDPQLTENTTTLAWYYLREYLNRPDDTSDIVDYKDDDVLSDESNDDWDGEDNQWCAMHLVEPTLSLPLRSRLRRKAWRMSDEGAAIRSPHRGCIDGRIFGSAKRKHDSGSVLIDCSGSMHLNSDRIDEIMEMLPGVTIATYCSDACYDGELRIIAKNGKRAHKEDLTNIAFMGNGVDGPALRWLAKQPEPRYWVCDGVVTGHNDSCSQSLREECHMLITKHNITRLHRISDVQNIADTVKRT